MTDCKCSRVAGVRCLMQVLAGAGAGLQEDMLTHIVMRRVQTTRQEYQLARPFLHGGTVMRNEALMRVLVSQF